MSTTNLSYKPLENQKHELFCRMYCSIGTEYFGNGTKSYAMAYGIDTSDSKKYNTAKSGGHDILTNPYILHRISELLDEGGFNDHAVDLQLLFLIKQSANLRVKLGAIKEYNRLRQRKLEKKEIIDQKIIDVSNMSLEEQMAYLQSKLRKR